MANEISGFVAIIRGCKHKILPCSNKNQREQDSILYEAGDWVHGSTL